MRIEYADSLRGGSPFPVHWGAVPSDETERRRWIHRNASRQIAAAPRGRGRMSGSRALAQILVRQLEYRRYDPYVGPSPMVRLAALLARRWDPAV